jgi:hypothetical protein
MTDKQDKIQAEFSNAAAEDAQTTVAKKKSYSGGDALLEDKVAIEGDTDRTGTDYPAATDISENADSDHAPITTTGAYPVSLDQLTDQGDFSIADDSPNQA